MAITKKAGESFGFTSVVVAHKGPARSVTLLFTVTKGTTFGHDDPMQEPSEHQFLSTLQVPASDSFSNKTFGPRDFADSGGFPSGFADGQSVDVNLAIGELLKAGQSLADWYSSRGDDDWDDNIYSVVLEAKAIPTEFAIGVRVIWVTVSGDFSGVIVAGPFPSSAFPGEDRWSVKLDDDATYELESRDLRLEATGKSPPGDGGGGGGGGAAPVLESISLTPPDSFGLVAGQTIQLAATAVFEDGQTENIMTKATWTWSSALNRISNGRFQARSVNNTTSVIIKISWQGLTDTVQGVVQGAIGL